MTELAGTARSLLSELVAFDTTSRNSNLALIDFVEERLRNLGAQTFRVENEDRSKANLHAVIGPDAPGGVLLSGHTDVVPVDGQDWSSDPWAVTERDGKLYGRGTCDMKGFLACALAAAPEFAAAGLSRPVHFAFTYDEEIGCLGAPDLIDEIVARTNGVNAVIVGEPTEMKVVTAHKGLLSFEVSLRGAEAHSSLVDNGACAVTAAVPLMSLLVEIGEEMRAAAPSDSPFEPAFGTLTIGEMHGGTALNILAKEACFASLLRPAPWDDIDAIEQRLRDKAAEVEADMKARAPGARITIKRLSRVPPLAPEADGEAERLARALTGDNARRAVSFGAEAGQFQQAGYSTVLCGPGSIEQAHQPDEFIAISQLHEGAAFMERLIKRLATDSAS